MGASSLRAYRAKPTAVADASSLLQRGTRYGEAVEASLFNKNHMLADEGSYFIARNPTPGTGLANQAAPTTLDDTKPFLHMRNNADGVTNLKRIYLDYIRLIVTAAGTNGTNIRYDLKIDNAARYTSGGTALSAVNVNMDDTTASVTNGTAAALNQIVAGAIVSPAAGGAARLLGGGLFRPVIPVVGDVYTINFGGADQCPGGLITSGTGIAHIVVNHHPIVIGPLQTFLLHIWLAAQSAASSYEIEMGWWER